MIYIVCLILFLNYSVYFSFRFHEYTLLKCVRTVELPKNCSFGNVLELHIHLYIVAQYSGVGYPSRDDYFISE